MLPLLLSLATAADLPAIELAGDATVMCLANGLRLGVLPQRDRPLAAVALAIAKGAADEGEHHGLAHLVEHLSFEVVNARGETRSAQLDAVGAVHNAFTDHDSVVYLSVGPRKAVRALLELEVDRLREPLRGIEAEGFAAERAVVRQELAETGGDALDPAMALALEVLPAGSPYAKNIGGSDASVAALALDEAIALAEAHYEPEHAALVLMGDFDTDQAWSLVEQSLPAEWLAEKVDCAAPEMRELGRADWPAAWPTIEAAVDEPTLAFGWPFEAIYSADNVDFVLEQVERSVEEAVCTRVELRAGHLGACFVPERGEEEVLRALERAEVVWEDLLHPRARSLYSAHRVSRVYRQQHARRAFETLDVSPEGTLAAMSRRLAVHGLFTYPVGGSKDRFTLEAVAHPWAKAMGPGRVRGAHLVPPSTDYAPGGEAHTAREPALLAGVLPTDEQIRDRIRWPDLSEVRTVRLESGARVTWLPGSQAEAVSVLQITSPTALDPWQWTGTRLWLGEPWSALSSDWRKRAYQAFTFPNVRTTSDGLALHAKSPQPMIAAAVLTKPAADLPLASRKSVSEEIEAFEAAREEVANDPESLAWAAILDSLGGDHPHPWLDGEGQERVLAVRRSDARALLAELAVPEHMHFAVVGGRLEFETLVRTIEGALGDIRTPRRSRVESAPEPPPAPTHPSLQVVDTHEPRTSVLVACRLDSDDAVARELLEMHLHTALNDALRGQLSLTYGVSVWQRREWTGNQLWVETSVPHTAAGATTAAILDALDTASRGEVDEDRLQRLKFAVASATAREFQTPDALAQLLLHLDWSLLEDEAEEADEQSEGSEEPETYADHLLAITPASLGEALSGCAGATQTVVVGREATVRASLAEAGLAVD